jgi:hypothetical protein
MREARKEELFFYRGLERVRRESMKKRSSF